MMGERMDYFTLNIFTILFLGIMVGYIIRRKHLSIKIDSYLVISVVILLFLIGMNLGSNGEIIQNLLILGIQSFMLAIASILGSALMAYIISRYVK